MEAPQLNEPKKTQNSRGSTPVYSTGASSSEELDSSVSREKMHPICSRSSSFSSPVQMRKAGTHRWLRRMSPCKFHWCRPDWDAAPETTSETNEKEKSIQAPLKFQRKLRLITVLLTMHEIGPFRKDWGRFRSIHRTNVASYVNNYASSNVADVRMGKSRVPSLLTLSAASHPQVCVPPPAQVRPPGPQRVNINASEPHIN